MSQAEREFIKQIDDMILGASPQALLKLAEIDKKTQLGGTTFYDVYSSLSDEDRKQILVATHTSKKE
ncbi:MAG: hypothetical protein ACREAX_04240 [Candidatus Nitrosotenuis sp.]